MDLTFSIVDRSRPFDLLARNFVGLREQFDSSRGLREYEQFAPAPESRLGECDRRYGTVSVSGDEPHFTLFRSTTHQAAPYSTVVVDVQRFAETGGGQDAAFAGLVKDENNYIAAWFSHTSGAVGLDAVVDGELHTLAAVDTPIDAPCRVAFCLTGVTVTALADRGEGFQPLVRAQLPPQLDLRQREALAEYHNAFGTRVTSGTVVISGVEAGYFGQTGLRDLHVVTHADGTPYIQFGKVFLTATQAGPGFFDTAHWGVWTLDLTNNETEHVASLFFQRDGSDSVFGDHAGHLVRDEANRRWIVATSTWGDFDGKHVSVHYATVPTSTDLLSGVHVLTTEPLPLPVDALPSETVGQWDPHLVQIDQRWYVAFVNARAFFDFYPALARSEPGGDLTSLALVGADADRNQTEGVVLQRFGGRWFLLASNGDKSPQDARDTFPVYDLSMTPVGALDAPHPTNIPWPMVFPTPQGRDRTRWMLLTFNGKPYQRDMLGYGTHGDLIVMEAKPITHGDEFPRR